MRGGPGARARAMGNSVSRPSCLGEKSRRPDELLRELPRRDTGLDAGQPPGRSATEAWPALPEKPPVENGWSVVSGAQSHPGSPVLKRSQSEVMVQNGSSACVPLRGQGQGQGQAGGATWTPPRAGVPRGTWSWKPVTTREVTEVTEVTETIVTEIVEVTEYPAGEKGGEPLVTRTVTVLTERAGEPAAGGRCGQTDTAEVTAGGAPRCGDAVPAPRHGVAVPAPLCPHTSLSLRLPSGRRWGPARRGGTGPSPPCAAACGVRRVRGV